MLKIQHIGRDTALTTLNSNETQRNIMGRIRGIFQAGHDETERKNKFFKCGINPSVVYDAYKGKNEKLRPN